MQDLTAIPPTKQNVSSSYAEQLIKNLFMQAPFAIQIVRGPDFIYELANKRSLEIMGRPAHEVIGRRALDVVPEIKDTLYRLLQQVYTTGERYLAEEEAVTYWRNGEKVDIFAKFLYEPLRDEHGKITGIIITGDDITAQVLARKKIEEGSKQLQSIKEQLEITFRNIPGGIYQFNGNGKLEYVNKKGAELMGYNSVEEVMAEPDMQQLKDHVNKTFIISDEAGQVVSQEKGSVYQAITTGKKAETVTQFVNKKTNQSFWIISNSTPVYNDDGSLGFVLTTATDITPQKLAEQKIRESERQMKSAKEQLEQSFENIPAGIFLISKNREILFVNDSAAVMSGYASAQEMMRVKDPKLVAARIVDRYEMYDEQGNPVTIDKTPPSLALQDGQRHETVLEVRDKKEQTSYWVLAKASPLFEADGKLSMVLAVSTNITTQKKAEQAVRQSEQRFRFLFDSNVLAVAFWKVGGEVYDANDSFLNLVGYSREEMRQGKLNWRKFTLPEDAELHEQKVRQAVAGATIAPYEMQYIHKNGQRISTLVGYAMLTGSQENGIAFMQDISKLKEAEDELRRSEEKYRQLSINLEEQVNQRTEELTEKNRQLSEAQQIAQLANWEWNPETNEVFWSEEMYGIYGYGSERFPLTFEKAVERMLPDEAVATRRRMQEHIVAAVRSFKETGETIFTNPPIDFQIRLPDGSGKFLRGTGKIILDNKGQISRIVGTVQDITEQKRSEEKIIEANEKLEQRNQFVEKLINSSLDLITVVDRELRFIKINKKAESVMRAYYPHDAIGKKITDINPSIKGTLAYDDLARAFQGEIIIRDKVKSTISENYYEYNYVPLSDSTGVYAVMIISHDITEGIRQTEELRKAIEADKLKSDFIKMASHELKTPVTSTKGYVQLLLTILKENDGQEKKLSPLLLRSSLVSIEKQLNRLTRLLTELLDLSRIESGQLELNREEFSINELAIDVVQDVAYTNPKQQINLYHDLTCKVYGDKDRLGQVIINLLTNAIKYSPGADKIDITIERHDTDRVAVQVRDYGIGIDKKFHERIFERFFRAEGQEEQTYPGFGIGLFIAKEIIQRHGGSIYVASEKRKGSLFTFTLPLGKKIKHE
ncbi:MAG: PAS domain S-box protein [Bacteroidetes bacterium]|nr:MAG: PAS domain S-box protein [Bacteroidota bacterium]